MSGDRSRTGAGPSTLVPRLGAFDAMMMVAGGVVGVGIFINPSEVARILGAPRAILLAWVLGGVAAMLGAIACAKLGRFLPRAGGLYVYLREAYHPALAFLYGWTALLAIFSGVAAAVSLTFARYAGVLFPVLLGWERLVAALLVAVLAAVNYRGVQLSATVQNVMTVAKLLAIAALALTAVAAVGLAGGAPATAAPPTGTGAFLFALFPVFMSYGGWYMLTFMAADVRRPERNLPIGMLGGLAVVIVTYALVNAAYMKVLTVPEIAASPAVGAEMALRVVGRGGADLITGLVLLSAPGVVNVLILSGSRLYFAMARDGLFFEGAARLHPRFGTPTGSIAAQAAWSVALLFTHTYGQLLQSSMFGEWTFFALVGASVFVFAARHHDFYQGRAERWMVGSSAVAFTAIALAVVGNALREAPRPSALGAALILAGLPVYAAWRRGHRPLTVRPGAGVEVVRGTAEVDMIKR